jgi:hypothetical protein
MALETCRPENVIHHSDRGSQYTALAFGERWREASVRPSMGSVGDAYDNAMAESFFGSLEREVFSRRILKTKAEAEAALFTYIEACFNPKAGTAASVSPQITSKRASTTSFQHPKLKPWQPTVRKSLEMGQHHIGPQVSAIINR